VNKSLVSPMFLQRRQQVGECWDVIFFAVETQSTDWLVEDDRLGD
jgi:hypothetical protein